MGKRKGNKYRGNEMMEGKNMIYRGCNQHSNTPSLQYSVASILHCSNTPEFEFLYES